MYILKKNIRKKKQEAFRFPPKKTNALNQHIYKRRIRWEFVVIVRNGNFNYSHWIEIYGLDYIYNYKSKHNLLKISHDL